MLVGSNHTGSFVQTELGAGRLVSIKDGSAQVRYFRAPTRNPYSEVTLDLRRVQPVSLAPHTRIYIHNGDRWRLGRIESRHPSRPDQYLVAFPNNEGAVLPIHAFDVRWAQSVDDPYEILASVGGDSPLVYQARLDLLAGWSRQRQFAAGVEGLLLGSVELHPHQLNVVRRISNDPVKRYLLADEVGLGKTIEAAALIWQILHRKPHGRVLILAPTHLRKQWAEELLDRFRTEQFENAWIRVRSHDDGPEWPTEPVDLLVIDEAHHVTRTSGASSVDIAKIRDLAHAAEGLLLLSATPVRSNEAGFLDLLHLLDPQHYQPGDLAEFTKRVELRDQLALICQALEPSLDAFDLSLYADELRGLFPEDTQLADLLGTATECDDADRPEAIERLRQHLAESYRLHHRVLRTRREGDLERNFSVRGRKRAVPFILSVPDDAGSKREMLLDTAREILLALVESGRTTESMAADIFRDLAARCGSLSPALRSLLTETGELDPVQLPELLPLLLAEDQEAIARDLRTVLLASANQTIDALVPHLTRFAGADGRRRVVIATQFTEVAEALADALRRHIGQRRVGLHLKHIDPRSNDASVAQWNANNDCSVLICDASAEEGLNLQRADLLIHVDLPWEAFRAEQRIGRCDRHAPDMLQPIRSVVISYGQQRYAQAWLELLSDGADVFAQSVSSLQYVLADLEATLLGSVLRRGYEAVEEASELYQTSLRQELTTIRAHDALDSLQDIETAQSSLNSLLLASDRDSAMTDGLVTWLEGVGGRVTRVKPGVIRLDRRRLQVSAELQLALAPAMGQLLAIDRRAGARDGLPVARAGHLQLDAIAKHLLSSDRGVAFAVFCPVRGVWPPRIVLRTDFLLTARCDPGLDDIADRLGVGPWLRQLVQECRPPTVVSLAMDPDGQAAPVAEPRRMYERRAGDLNLTSRPDLFRQLTQHVDWEAVCANALPLARALLNMDAAVQEQAASAAINLRRKLAQRVDRQRGRRAAGNICEDDQGLEPLLAATPDQIDMSVEVLGCGALLSGDPSSIDRTA